MLTPGKLYVVLTTDRSKSGPAEKFKDGGWGIGVSFKKHYLLKDGTVLLCVEQFKTSNDFYSYPNKIMGVFLYNNEHHIFYEDEVKEV